MSTVNGFLAAAVTEAITDTNCSLVYNCGKTTLAKFPLQFVNRSQSQFAQSKLEMTNVYKIMGPGTRTNHYVFMATTCTKQLLFFFQHGF